MKVGDKVKVKSLEEILKTLNGKYSCINFNKSSGSIYFNREGMSPYINLTGTISYIDQSTGNIQIKFKERNCLFWWHPSWLELIPKELDVDKDCNPKWVIFCMIFQYLSGNLPDPSIFNINKGTPIKIKGGFNYHDFSNFSFEDLKNNHKPFPDWPILNIPLDEAYVILEHCYKYGKGKKDLEFFTQNVGSIIFSGFPWIDVPESNEYWNDRYVYYKGMTPKEELEIVLTQIKTENYENKLQRKKSIVIRGTVPEGSITCGRKRKTSIAVGYLSNSVCIGG